MKIPLLDLWQYLVWICDGNQFRFVASRRQYLWGLGALGLPTIAFQQDIPFIQVQIFLTLVHLLSEATSESNKQMIGFSY